MESITDVFIFRMRKPGMWWKKMAIRPDDVDQMTEWFEDQKSKLD